MPSNADEEFANTFMGDGGARGTSFSPRKWSQRCLVLDLDGMHTGLAVDLNNEGVVRIGHIDLNLSKRNVDGDADIHVSELGLGRKNTVRPLSRLRMLGSWKQLTCDVGSKQHSLSTLNCR